VSPSESFAKIDYTILNIYIVILFSMIQVEDSSEIIYEDEPVIVEQDNCPNSDVVDPICISTMTSDELTCTEMVMAVCRIFNKYAVYESYPDPDQYDKEDYISRIVFISQRACETYYCSFMSVYLEHDNDIYHLWFTTGQEDNSYTATDSYCNSQLYFTFENRFEAMEQLLSILKFYYYPYSTIDMITHTN